ncbi:zinc ABC transporter substrate-binding protein [Rhodoferax sp.]|uniref:metal ABC transporter solute-binding protein, Zn/Mn family n=1 Tax=Rhodoferax sp. TaxID=50421 RepID=UPI0026279DED|nr:zinc ABC transporter substrate-binding protein [Rhodoferax sp.]MDD5480322.1 zinc ABC transporter substrate-binding protein [Rhodoferax sp.]
MKRNTLKLFALSALTAGGWFTTQANAAEPMPVVASFSILGDLVKVVGGERVKVTLLAGPNADAHEFAPSPADAKTVLGARAFVVNGLSFEPWAQKLAKSAGYQGETVVASKGVKPRQMATEPGHGHAETDPHAWQNPLNVVQYVANIAAGLAKADPSGAATYQANAAAYAKQLQDFDAQAKAQLDAIAPTQRKVITSHDAFGYLAARYGITMLAPEGVNTDSEPSAKHVAELIRQIKREKIKAVFVENMSNPKLITQLSQDAGVSVGATLYSDALSAPGGVADTYLKMMHHNVTQLAAGMRKN